MLLGNKVVVVLPAYNAARTLEQTYREIPLDIVDEVVRYTAYIRDWGGQWVVPIPAVKILS